MSLLFFPFVLIGIALLVFQIWALVDVLRTPTTVWDAAGQNQLLWGIVVLFFSLLGAILYIVIARPQLLAAQASQEGPYSSPR